MREGWRQHRGLRPLLFSNSGVDLIRSHKNQIERPKKAFKKSLKATVLNILQNEDS